MTVSYVHDYVGTQCLYLRAHPGIDGVSVPGPALGQRQRAPAQLRHELGHVHDGDGVEAACQPCQVLHVVRPASTACVNTPRRALACRGPLACRRAEAAAGARLAAPASRDRPPPGSEAGRCCSGELIDSGIPGNGSCNHILTHRRARLVHNRQFKLRSRHHSSD